MASVTYSSGTVIPVAWLNDVNGLTYTGQFPLTTQSWALGTTPLTYASQGMNGFIYNTAAAGNVSDNALLRIHSVNRNANIQLLAGATNESGVQFLNGATSLFMGGFSYDYITNNMRWKNTPLGVVTDLMYLTPTGGLQMVGPASTMGYGAGSGGTVTQATSKSTSVTLNKGSGQITMNNAALGAGVAVSFNLNNSLVSTTDTPLIVVSGSSNYRLDTFISSPGVIGIRLTNISAGSLSDALILNFTLIKGITA